MESGRAAQERIKNITTPSACSPVILGSTQLVPLRENAQKTELGAANLLFVKVKMQLTLATTVFVYKKKYFRARVL